MLVLTNPYDATADVVLRILAERGVPVVRTDPGIDLQQGAALTTRYEGGGQCGTLTTATRVLDLGRVRSVWYRRPSMYEAPAGMEGQDAAFARSQAYWGVGGILAALPGAHYVNHPWRVREAEHKPAQLHTALTSGFTVPATVITTNPAEAREFCRAQAGGAVYKPLWNSPYKGEDGRAVQAWVSEVRPQEITDAVAACPHLFQAKVDKAYDVRLTAVGERLFAVRIDGPDLDWRRYQNLLTYTQVPVPEDVAGAVARYLDAFGLVFGAFDFGVDAAGRWHFFECNANGQWAWFPPPITGLIAEALADRLQRGTKP
ncbi:ATP-grasp ribosomal peptide maturase [Streptomyces sp. FH025]|uniref:ATP-grasp ribosomal peptide maturase n=1 Tax=Streptomyces sp. FH025 TaxID=2815937 RepID=UPI0027DC665D|nr:ATP-grasp ribosomal peptide maturase [Streptomyces sp. FH025]